MIPTPGAVLKELRSAQERFRSGLSRHPHCSRERRLEVEGAQHPIAVVLGCAVSRLLVELLGDTGFDDLFDVRKAGTMSTTAAIASLEYAVAYLAAPAIVVLGHQRCGAVEAAFHAELGLTPSRPRVVGQLRMELFVLAAAEDRSRPAASMPSTRREIWWIPAFRRLHHAAAARP